MKIKVSAVIFTTALYFFSGFSEAAIISFVQYPPDSEVLQGIDGDTSGWSTDDTMVSLAGAGYLSLLGGTANADGYTNGNHGTFTHRGTRGIGVLGQENDEVDSYANREKIELTFTQPQFLNSFEVRSLFYEPNLLSGDGRERGAVDLWLNGSSFFTQNMIGDEDIRISGTKGIVSFAYNPPKIIDKIEFYVPQGQWYTYQSEFAVAKLNVDPIFELRSILLFGCGLIIFLPLVVTKIRGGRNVA